jgi:LPXTG-motif cell wall-anchored protein
VRTLARPPAPGPNPGPGPKPGPKPGPGPKPHILPATGVDLTGAVFAGAVLLAAGAVLLPLRRKRATALPEEK